MAASASEEAVAKEEQHSLAKILGILVLLVLGWPFMFFGQWTAARARAEGGRPIVAADVHGTVQVSS